MPRNPGSTTLQLGLSALLIVLVQGLLWGQSVGFGSAIEDWQHAAGSVGSAFGSQLSIQFSAQAAHGLQCGAEALLAVLALVLLFELTRSLPAALQGAMVLATSPHQAEFATVLSTRPLLLFGVCGMALLVSWARFRSSGRKLWWALAVLAQAGALVAGPARGAGGLVLLPLLLIFDLVVFTGPSLSLRLDLGELWRQRSRFVPFAIVAGGAFVLFANLRSGLPHSFVSPFAGRSSGRSWGAGLTPDQAIALAAVLSGGVVFAIAVAGRVASECFREARLAAFGAVVLASSCLLTPAAGSGFLMSVGTALLWSAAGLAAARAATARLGRLIVLASVGGALLVLQVIFVRGGVQECVRQDELAREVEAATQKVLPLLAEPLANGMRIRPEFAPVAEDALRALVGRLAGVADPGVRNGDPRADLVLRWQGRSGWMLH